MFRSYYTLEVLKGIGLGAERAGCDLLLQISAPRTNLNPSAVEGVIFLDIDGNEELVDQAVGEAAEALGRMDRALAGLGLDFGVVFQVVTGAEGLVAGAGDDGDPQLGVGLELVESVDQLLVRHGMAGVIDLGTIDGDDHQTAVFLDLTVLAHGVSPLVLCCQ